MKKRIIPLLFILVVLVLLFGITYAIFNYTKVGEENRVITGDLYLNLVNGTDSIYLQNVYPMSKEKARELNDNTITFTVNGKNTSKKENIYYEIDLINGTDEDGLTRFNPEHLVFDLIEIGDNNTETYLLDAVSFPDINNRKIWIDTVLSETNEEIERTYKLRMWLDENVLISDTDPNADYTASNGVNDFKNHYASVKVKVSGDLKAKSLPSSVITRNTYVENGKSYFKVNLSNDYLMSEEGELLEDNDEVRIVITNPDSKIYFTYRDDEGNEVTTKSESLDLTYTYNRNKTIQMFVYTESKNDVNVNTELNFKIYKNGSLVQEYNKRIDVVGNNYCLNNGFTNLADCILVTENLSDNVASAKTYIASKGSPDVTETAPAYTYTEQFTDNFTYYLSNVATAWTCGDKYVFDNTTGRFALKQSDGVTDALARVQLTDDMIGKYTCGSSEPINCSEIYKITSIDIQNSSITGTKISSLISGGLSSEHGLYKVIDDYGDSYIYRGDVENNNVYFGGLYWKILRINGDSSIRLIYNGSTLASNGNIGAGNSLVGINGRTYQYNVHGIGTTYVGYMINENSTEWIGPNVNRSLFRNADLYYFADSYEVLEDADGKYFKLTKNNYDTIRSTLGNLTTEQISKTPYTCRTNPPSDTCRDLLKVNSVIDTTTMNVSDITFLPDYITNPTGEQDLKALMEKNTKDSNIKKQIDLWYQNDFSLRQNNGKNVTDYIADNTFCNNRNISRSNRKSGYLLTETTWYDGFTNLSEAIEYHYDLSGIRPSLECVNVNDRFSTTIDYGNAKLTYPIGLITADELIFAGAKYLSQNPNFYLNGGVYYTMTPGLFNNINGSLTVLYLQANGMLSHTSVTTNDIIRPLINLKLDTIISGGDGTATNPYTID